MRHIPCLNCSGDNAKSIQGCMSSNIIILIEIVIKGFKNDIKYYIYLDIGFFTHCLKQKNKEEEEIVQECQKKRVLAAISGQESGCRVVDHWRRR